ncbi:MAG: sugar transferase [Gaiellaceae bacterium]
MSGNEAATLIGPEAIAQLREPGARGKRRRGRLIVRTLVVADLFGLVAAFLTSELVFGSGSGGGDRFALDAELLVFALTLPAWILAAKLHELYDHDEERADHSTVDDFVGVFHVVTLGAWVFFFGSWITGLAAPNLSKLFLFWALAIVLVTASRALGRAHCRKSAAYVQNTVIVGAGDIGQLVARKLLQHPEYGINPVGFVDADPKPLRPDIGDLAILGPPDELPELVGRLGIDRVIVAFSSDPHEQTVKMLGGLKRLDLQIDIVPRLFEVVGPNVGVHTVESLPLVGLPAAKLLPLSKAIKRLGDIVIAGTALLATAPLFAYVALRIKLDSPGPVFFRQTRLGMDMREFSVLKFRSMRVDADDGAHREFIKQTMDASASPTTNGLFKLERDDAITPFGRWLRKTSLDELPQLINVLRGDMSLVGPRPCIPYETEHFAERHFERFSVPAGITGLWQVSARAHATFGEALDMDVAYARNWSLGLDLELLARTPAHLLRRKGTA